MSEQKIIYSYKGYNYKSISLYKNPEKDNVFHVVAGKDEHTTPFYFAKKKGNWSLMIGCSECDACLVFFDENDTAQDRYDAAIKAVTDGAYIYEGYSPSMEYYTGHYYAQYN